MTADQQNSHLTRRVARPRYRAPTGLPKGRENRRLGAIVSLLLHLLIIYLLITPFVVHHPIHEIAQGAGEPGPSGGGGGGRGGTGGDIRKQTERLDFVAVQAAPKAPTQAVPPPLPKPKVVPPRV
ncbi:MAG TPA: hypothetical protein VIJ16_11360, partial [Gemmatimonadaceae bacterium]